MKKIGCLALLMFFFSTIGFAQIENPVTWNFTADNTGAKQYDVHMTATVTGNWHIYAQVCGEGQSQLHLVSPKIH